MAEVRNPARAGSFYPGTKEACVREVAACRLREPQLPEEMRGTKILGGLVPHAGWTYSGATALAVFDALAGASPRPETVLFFATAHRPDVDRPSLQSHGLWRVPNGEVSIDQEFAQALIGEANKEEKILVDRSTAHEGDHAIEVQLPFLMETLPGARFVPVAMPLCAEGPLLGSCAARAAQRLGRPTVALASTDLTHYGPNYYGFSPHGIGHAAHRWSKEVNDQSFLKHVLALDAEGAYKTAAADRSACGPAAAAAAIAFAKEQGAQRGLLLEHVTSWERAQHEQGEPEDFVGYAGVVFV